MIAVNLQEAKAKLNQLVEAACAGEDVVLMRGSKVIATLKPLSEKDLEISPQISDDQAERFWKEVDRPSKHTSRSIKKAVERLKNN